MSYAFLNPFVDGKIWSPGNGSIDLSFVGEDKIPFMSDVEIKIGMACDFELTVNLSPTYEAAVDLIDNHPWIRLGNTVGIRWGYNDGNPAHVSDWIYGFMQMPEINFGDEISLAIKANGVGWNLSTNESVKTWGTLESMTTLRTVFETMAKRRGISIVWEIDENQNEYFDQDLTFVQAGITDYEFMIRYARGCTTRGKASPVAVIFKGKNIHFVTYSKEKSEPVAEFHMYGKPDHSKNIFAMHDFQPENYGALFLPKRTVSGFLYGANSDPEVIPEKVDSAGNKAAGTGAGTENNSGGKETLESTGIDGEANPDTGHKFDVENDPLTEGGKIIPILMGESAAVEDAQALVDNIRQQDAGDFGVGVSFNTQALPTIYPMQYIRCKGVTQFFSTDYQIKELTIGINDNGAEMAVNAWATGIPEGMAWFAQEVNNSEQGETKPDDGLVPIDPAPYG